MGKNVARTEEQVRAWLETQGYGLEHETARAFGKAGFRTRIAKPYRDPEQDKIREIDVVCRASVRSDVPIILAVECKAATTGAWVFRRAELTSAESKWHPIGTPAEVGLLVASAYALNDAFPLRNPVAYAVREAAPLDGAYAAINQAIDAAFAVAEDSERAIVIPVVVVDTPLFRVAYDVGTEAVESTQREYLL